MSKTKKRTETVIDFGEIFDNYIAANEKVWEFDRSKTLGASETFKCIRQNWFNKRGEEFGYKPDEDFKQKWGAMERGNVIENHFVVPAVTDHMPGKLKMEFHGDAQKTLVTGRTSATQDGLITGLKKGSTVVVKYRDREICIDDIISDCIGFEIKSVDPMTNLSDEKSGHNYQTHMQMGTMRATTKWRPHFTIILYINASWLDDITPFVVEYDETIYDVGVQRGKDIWEVDDPELLIPEGRMDDGCEYCKWRDACGTVILNSIPDDESEGIKPDDLIELEKFALEYQDAQKSFKAAETAKKAAQERIKEILVDNQKRRAGFARGSVSWAKMSGKETLDKEAMIDDGIDVAKYTKYGRDFDRLSVTIRKPKNEQ